MRKKRETMHQSASHVYLIKSNQSQFMTLKKETTTALSCRLIRHSIKNKNMHAFYNCVLITLIISAGYPNANDGNHSHAS